MLIRLSLLLSSYFLLCMVCSVYFLLFLRTIVASLPPLEIVRCREDILIFVIFFAGITNQLVSAVAILPYLTPSNDTFYFRCTSVKSAERDTVSILSDLARLIFSSTSLLASKISKLIIQFNEKTNFRIKLLTNAMGRKRTLSP